MSVLLYDSVIVLENYCFVKGKGSFVFVEHVEYDAAEMKLENRKLLESSVEARGLHCMQKHLDSLVVFAGCKFERCLVETCVVSAASVVHEAQNTTGTEMGRDDLDEMRRKTAKMNQIDPSHLDGAFLVLNFTKEV